MNTSPHSIYGLSYQHIGDDFYVLPKSNSPLLCQSAASRMQAVGCPTPAFPRPICKAQGQSFLIRVCFFFFLTQHQGTHRHSLIAVIESRRVDYRYQQWQYFLDLRHLNLLVYANHFDGPGTWTK
jgi:hypothetical protein